MHVKLMWPAVKSIIFHFYFFYYYPTLRNWRMKNQTKTKVGPSTTQFSPVLGERFPYSLRSPPWSCLTCNRVVPRMCLLFIPLRPMNQIVRGLAGKMLPWIFVSLQIPYAMLNEKQFNLKDKICNFRQIPSPLFDFIKCKRTTSPKTKFFFS